MYLQLLIGYIRYHHRQSIKINYNSFTFQILCCGFLLKVSIAVTSTLF
ncbi:hypothetical protein RGQ29_002402 [Quercus rubra]|uniref:Uncharacterized protein n=1 Tax=Quercus rubra TaxID=3512 RepID=A0AAN7I5H0_QUERU|nr:hypothetical protein RGQ29_031845 [Quercus rubra]KAK4566166.1 hypothetical protein RGQ29_002402 [Quercus rubra]